jgi:phage gp29-like protein
MNANLKNWIINKLGLQEVVEDQRGQPESIANYMDAASIASALHQAEQGYVADLWSLYDSIIAGDTWIQSMLSQRKLAVLNDVITAEPKDKDNPNDRAAADAVNAAMSSLRRFRMQTLSHLMDGVLRPVSVCEMVFRANVDQPGRFLLDRIVPVPHYCQDFASGKLALLKQDANNRGMVGTATYPVETHKHIVHRGHLLTAPDNWGGPMRCLVFLWLLRTCNREWWARSLERWGAPVPVGKYPSGDAKAKASMQAAFSRFYRLGGLTISDNSSVELIAGAAAGDGSAWEKLQNWAERQITIMILGQELSSGAQSTGLGSGVADLQSAVRDDIRLMDSVALAETLTSDFAATICTVNSIPGKCNIKIGLGTNVTLATSLATFLSSLSIAGLEPKESGVMKLSQLSGIDLQRKTIAAPSFGSSLPPNMLSSLSSLFARGMTPERIVRELDALKKKEST